MAGAVKPLGRSPFCITQCRHHRWGRISRAVQPIQMVLGCLFTAMEILTDYTFVLIAPVGISELANAAISVKQVCFYKAFDVLLVHGLISRGNSARVRE